MGVGRTPGSGTRQVEPSGVIGAVPRRVARRPVVRALAAGIVCLATIAACDRSSVPPPAPPNSPTTANSPASPTPTGTAAGRHAPRGFVSLPEVDATILTDIRYGTPHNFVGRPITGYREPLCLLTRQAADALHRVQSAARAQGRSLKVYDCYRPQQAVDDFVRWAKRPAEQQMKAEFYPRVNKSALFDEGYVDSPTAHSRGSTVDLTLVAVPTPGQRPYVPGEPLISCTAPQRQRFADNTIDMGTGFDCFDPLAHTDDSRITSAVRENRMLLRTLMTDGGFVNYPEEWWHYGFTNEPYPDTYFDFPVERSALAPR